MWNLYARYCVFLCVCVCEYCLNQHVISLLCYTTPLKKREMNRKTKQIAYNIVGFFLVVVIIVEGKKRIVFQIKFNGLNIIWNKIKFNQKMCIVLRIKKKRTIIWNKLIKTSTQWQKYELIFVQKIIMFLNALFNNNKKIQNKSFMIFYYDSNPPA